MLFTVSVGTPSGGLGEHGPLIIAFFLLIVSHRKWRVHETSAEVSGDVDQFGRLDWNVRGNRRSLDSFKWRGRSDKCRKKVVKGAGIFCRNVCVRREQ